ATPFSIEACYGAVDLGNRYTLEEVEKHDMLSAMVVAHPHHAASSARWIAEARSNPKIVGVKLHPALGNYDVLSPDVFRLMDDAVETLLEVAGADRILFGTDAPLYLPAPFSRLLEALSISEQHRENVAYRNALAVIPALAGRPGVAVN